MLSKGSHNRVDDWAIGARLAESITEHLDIYQSYLGDDYFLFAFIADNIVAAKQFSFHRIFRVMAIPQRDASTNTVSKSEFPMII